MKTLAGIQQYAILEMSKSRLRKVKTYYSFPISFKNIIEKQIFCLVAQDFLYLTKMKDKFPDVLRDTGTDRVFSQ